MFYGKRIKAIEKRLAKAEQFEKGVCTVIDNYFATNEKKDLKFSTDCVCDKFYHFVMSVDEKLKALAKVEEESKAKDEIIKAREQEIKEIAEERSALQIQLIAKNRESKMEKNTTAKGGKK